jgi:hypothetical protein
MTASAQAPEQALKQIGDELRARARLSGSFNKPADLEIAIWQVMLSFGTAEEMGKLMAMERMERERIKMPPLSPHYRACDTWHLSVRPTVPLEAAGQLDGEAVKQAYAILGMLVAAIGVPKDQLLKKPVETVGHGENIMHWQWRDE